MVSLQLYITCCSDAALDRLFGCIALLIRKCMVDDPTDEFTSHLSYIMQQFLVVHLKRHCNIHAVGQNVDGRQEYQ